MTGPAPLDREEFRRWREEADRALAGARLQAGAGLHNWARFAAEQASPDASPSGTPGAHYGPADGTEALEDAGAVLAFVDRAWERLGG